jgi:DNA-binding winged helix-turn-helix (wHTH) protein
MDKKLKNFLVNDVEVDAVKNFIVRGGEKIDISPKQVRILQCLVQNRGALVTYDELETYIRDEQSGQHGTTLYQHIASLRKALGTVSCGAAGATRAVDHAQ